MSGFLAENAPILVGLAIATFVAVVASLVWEQVRSWRQKRQVQDQLRRLSSDAEVESTDAVSLLREERSEQFGWLEPLIRWLPHRRDLQRLLDQADMSWSVEGYLVLTGGVSLTAGVVGLVVSRSAGLALVAAFSGAFVPYFMLRRKRSKRLSEFEENFSEAIDLLARSIKAGHALSTGLKVVVEEAPEPVCTEFRQVFEEQRYGMPLRESLLGLAGRIDLLDVRMFTTSVLIQRESGGNLAEILDGLSELIRERFRFRRQIKVHTAHGRMTGYVLAGAPIAAGVLLWSIDPEYMRPLFTEDLGQKMVGFALGWQLIGFYVIRRILQIEY